VNVRELRNVVERCVLVSDDHVFPLRWLLLPAGAGTGLDTARMSNPEGLFLPMDGSMSLDEMEKHIVTTALERTGFNVAGAARLLNTTRETLRYRVQKFGLIAHDAGTVGKPCDASDSALP
jgi:transcriptional regulator with GAF, ATPase, and Fis domain